VGAELPILKDYLEMEHVGEDQGLEHAGYLVVVRGEVVRLLYVGGTSTGDPDWTFAEVLRTLRKEPVGRRGWLPVAVLTENPKEGTAPPQQTAKFGGGQLTGSSSATGRVSPPAASAAAAANGRRPGSSAGVAGQTLQAAEAFPALRPGGTETNGAAVRSAWGSKRGTPAPSAEQGDDKEPVKISPQDRKVMIERQKLAAKKAASDAKHQPKCCPICADPYTQSAERRMLRRPCCKMELCATCDHKSLRSGRCYYCREVCDEFPTLGLACRVLTERVA